MDGEPSPDGAPAPDGEPSPDGAPAPDGEPDADAPENDIMPTALTDVHVTVKQNGGEGSTEIQSGTDLTWQHNQLWQLDVAANFSGVADGQVQITVAPGLRIESYFDGSGSGNFDSVATSSTLQSGSGLINYTFPKNYDTVTYDVSDTAALVSIDLTLAVDTVLWPKVNGWTINDAIQVKLTGTDTDETRTANVTVNCATNEASASWNQLHSADSNLAVPSEAGSDFRMKYMVIAPNLHGQPLGMYYPQLTLTVPLPQVKDSSTYAAYSKVETAPGTTPVVSEDNASHTVTFTWTNLYVPAGSSLTVTPYFKWASEQRLGTKVVFASGAQFKVEATPYKSLPITFSGGIDTTKTEFTVQGNVNVSINGQHNGNRTIYNYGSTTQVYQLGQFQVRNDGFDDTGELTLNFTYSSDNAHVTAQRIPLKVNGKVTSITYTTNSGGPQEAEIQDEYYNKGAIGSIWSYLLIAPEGQYFTSVTAVIDGFSPQYVGYNSSAALSPNNGCVTYGTMANGETTGAFTSKLTISGSGLSENVTGDINSTITNSGKQTTQMKVDPAGNLFTFQGEPTNKAQLGTDKSARTVRFSGYISATEYPYGNNQVVDRPVIYIRLPNAIQVENIELYSSQTNYAGTATGDTLIDSSAYTTVDHSERGGNGYHVYSITFENDNTYRGAIGWFNSQLGQTRLKLTFDMVADVTVEDVTLQMYDTVLVGYADHSKIQDSGSLSANQRADANDVDGDNDRDEKFSTMADNAAFSLELDAPRIGLNFNSYAKLSTEEDGSYKNFKVPKDNVEGLEANGHIMYITGDALNAPNAGIDFRFTAKNETGSALSIKSDALGSEDFYYYIPVPKKGDRWDDHIQDDSFELSLIIDEPVKVTESPPGLVEVLYSTTVVSTDGEGGSSHYNNAAAVPSNYKTWDEVQGQADQIRMIRISVKQGLTPEQKSSGFPNGYQATFDIKYKFVEADKTEIVGKSIEFGPCGITTYKRNNADASGHTPTQRVRAEIQTGIIAGRVFIDKDFNGIYDASEKISYGEDGITISAQHKVGADPGMDPDTETHNAAAASVDAYDNSYELTGLQARTYTVTVSNGAYTEGAPKANSLRFISLPEGGGGTREVNGTQTPKASSYTAGYRTSTTFDVMVNGSAQNRMMDIGLQRPHAVTFQVQYVDNYPTSASSRPDPIDARIVYVWHGDTLNKSGVSRPSFLLDSDFQWEGDGHPVWAAPDRSELETDTAITADVTYTAKAVRKQHTVTYVLNPPEGYSESQGVPVPETAVNGQSVHLKCVNGDATPKPSATGSDTVVFLGWTAAPYSKIYGKETQKDDLPALLTEVIMQAADQTVYALWGYDTNGNGTADALEDRYTVTYNAGQGSNPPAKVENCLVNEKISLAAQGSMTPPVGNGNKVLFVGWKEGTDPGEIYDKGNIASKGSIDANLHDPESSYTVTGDVTLYAAWAYDENENNIPDYRETMYQLRYNDNGVSSHPGDYPTDANYLPGTKVTLGMPSTPWKGMRSGQSVVFVGWSEKASDPVDEDPKDLLVETVTMPEREDKTVYAVWAYDRNNNGEPDYKDTWYTLSYNKNGGSGEPADVPDSVKILPGGSSVTLPKDTIKWEKTDDGKRGIFVGWSLEQAEEIFDQEGKATVGGKQVSLRDNTFVLTSPYQIDSGVRDNITLYAVYAEDENGREGPDYMETAWQVYYYANGGTAADPGVTVESDGLFRKCGHHHVAGELGVSLLTVEIGRGLIGKENAVLLGWSLNENVDTVKTKAEETEAQITTTVDIPGEGAEQFVKVYAVWAEDLNRNHKPDYEDEHWHQWYYYNKALADWTPDGSNDEDEARGMDASMPDGVDHVNFGTETLPETINDILTGTAVKVPGATLKERTDYGSGGELHHYIQLGWSGYCHPAAASAEEAKAWIHTDEDAAQEGVQRLVSGAIYQYNFAVWALDDNHNNIADYNDPHYALTFDLKGGTGGPGDREAVLEGGTVVLSPAPVKDRALFLGWSASDLCSGGDLRAAPTESLLGTGSKWTMPGEDTTLYAVWAEDRDGNNKPDYEQQITLSYNGNPQGGGAADNVPEKQTVLYVAGIATLSDMIPTHTPVEGQDVAFIAWSGTQTNRIYGRSERSLLQGDAPFRYAPGGAFPLPGDTEEVTLYAVWGYDTNSKNGVDVLERRYTLTYDANGGSFAPDPLHGRLEGERIPLSKDARYSRENVILVGWTSPENKLTEILTWDNAHSRASELDSKIIETYTMGAADATVYAVWAEDQNANSVPDYRESKNLLTYHYSGAAAPEDPPQDAGYLPGMAVPLWKDANAGTSKAWNKGEGSGRSVFVGWTLSEEMASKVLTEAPGPGDLAEEAIMSGNVDVYALWAHDRNGNGLPDHSEKKITLTLDPNGGSEGTEAALPRTIPDLLPGTYTGLALEEAAAWTKTVDGLDLVFAGWSETPLNGYIDGDGFYRDAARAEGVLVEEVLVSDPYPVPGEDLTLYAVYAADENGDDSPDYGRNDVHVEYYANGGTSASGKWLNGTKELFYLCTHRHAPGERETELLTVEQASAYISRPGALLMGWGTHPAALCLTKAQLAAALSETVTLPASGGGNARLYAVWAADENENGIPDYEETVPEPAGTLTVSKTVKGRAGEKDRSWHFRVELSDTGLSGLYGDMLFEKGVAEFTLKHGKTATASELPAGLRYTVTEREDGKDGYTTEATRETGTIPEEGTVRVSFVNSRETAPANDVRTGDGTHAGAWLGLLLLSTMGLLLSWTPLLQKRPRPAAGKRKSR